MTDDVRIVDFATRATQLQHAGIDRYFGRLLSVDQVRRNKLAKYSNLWRHVATVNRPLRRA